MVHKRILSISYDEHLLKTRATLLEDRGYEVTSVRALQDALDYCRLGGFDLLLVGHSMAKAEQERVMKAFRMKCRAPILLLLRPFDMTPNDPDYHVVSLDPAKLIEAVGKLLPR